jgi:short-subunit dehydrogenase
VKTFKDKVAAITGAGSGIGRALAMELAAKGCHLALSDVNEQGLAESMELLAPFGVKVTTAKVNVAQKEDVEAWSQQVVQEHGKVNMIFNNAGVNLSGSVADTSYEDYEWILGINLWGVIHGTKAFLPLLQQNGEEGHIINVSSMFGLFAQPTQSGYNMSKFAVRGFTESLRQELDLSGGKVSCTCVHPGGVKTNIARNARMTKGVESLSSGASAENMRERFETFFITTAQRAARVILGAVKSNQRRVLVGPDARLGDVMQRILPKHYQNLVTTSFKLVSH